MYLTNPKDNHKANNFENKKCSLETHDGSNTNLLGTNFGTQNSALGVNLIIVSVPLFAEISSHQVLCWLIPNEWS